MIGTKEEIEKKALLQESLDSLKRNVEACGGLDVLKERYPKGYKKLIHLVNEDAFNLQNAIFTGYKCSSVLSKEEFMQLWGDRKEQVSAACKKSFSADAVEKIYADFLHYVTVDLYPLVILDKSSL